MTAVGKKRTVEANTKMPPFTTADFSADSAERKSYSSSVKNADQEKFYGRIDISVVVILRHESLGSPEQLVMDYLAMNAEITNSIGRDITGIKSENTMKEVFYRLRDRDQLEQVPNKFGNKAAWQRKVN